VKYKKISNTPNIKIDVTNLPAGIYIVKLSAGKETLMEKFTVTR